MTAISVNINILNRIVLVHTYRQYMKERGTTVVTVNINLAIRVISICTYIQYMKN